MVVKVGVCCMDVKLFSRPMASILNRIRRYDDVVVIPFGNAIIFNKPVEEWPIVDFLICFYSAGFPLAKAEEYVKLRDPICFNDVLSQHILLDRRAVYELLKLNGIPVPSYSVFKEKGASKTATTSENQEDFRRMLLEQKNEEPTPEEIQQLNSPVDISDFSEDISRKTTFWGNKDPIQENEDCITVNGRKIKKPFVEKPIWAEDHSIYIYYPKSSGGGSTRLFRKIGDRSSRFYPNVSTVRRGGDFIYEEFISTDGMDIKVYTIGPDYAHAEARKAPTVDGRVKRTADGKEMRYHVILTQQEKEIARKITHIFGQNICGFDILRSDGSTYVCDVNGWSFVKGSPKYYNDCAQIIYEMILFYLHPITTLGISHASLLLRENDEQPSDSTASPRGKELRCLLAVIRHGDRTPKQKVKVKVRHPLLLQFFNGKDQHSQVKLKNVKEMEEFAQTINSILEEDQRLQPSRAGKKVSESRCKPKYRPPSRTASPVSSPNIHPIEQQLQQQQIIISPSELDENARRRLTEIAEELRGNDRFSGINRKVQLKPLEWRANPNDDSVVTVTRALLIFKYGGQLTDMGNKQSDYLGKRFRQQMYPADRIGMLSLHSSFAHDIKFYASDEGRVQMTAAVFARAFLELDEEEIVPILYALVWNDKRANMLLEHSCSDSVAMMTAKRQLSNILNSDIDFSESNRELDPTQLFDGVTAEELRRFGLGKIGNPYRELMKIKASLENVCHQMQEIIEFSGFKPYHIDVIQRIHKSWAKLTKAFFDEPHGRFDISKVPEISDGAKFLILHLDKSFGVDFRGVYKTCQPLSTWAVAQEYGLTEGAKHKISEEVVRPLVDKIISDLRQMRERKQLQTVSRFYFTSESHLNSLLTTIEAKLGMPLSGTRSEDYCSHFVFKMHEDMAIPINDPRRFRVEIWHSQGSNAVNLQDPPGTIHNFVLPLRPLRLNLTLDEFIKFFS